MALAPGSNVIDFSLPAVDGNTYSVSQFSDAKAIAVIFSCNHCPYVLAWEDRLIELQNDFKDRGVEFILINSNDAVKKPADSFDQMVTHSSEKGFPFPYVHDESQDIARQYGAERTPEIFLFDADGKLQYHGAPDDNYEDPTAVQASYFRDALEAVLAGQAPATASTPPVGCTIKWKD